MSNLIDRQAAISAICNACGKIDCDKTDKCEKLQLPPANNSEFPNSSDTISRKAAMDALEQGFKDTTNGIDKLSPTYGLIKATTGIYKCYIGKLPHIQPKRGRWIYCEDTTADCVDGYRCDQCGLFVPWDYKHKGIDYIKDYNFCPHCGADMRGVTE